MMLQIRKGIKNTVFVELGKNEIEVFIASCNFVNTAIRGGFHARIGASREELQALIVLMQSASIALSKNCNLQTISIQISLEELRILVQIFNEVCHGLYISDLELQIGSDRNTLKSLLRLTGDFYRDIKNSS